MEVASMEDQGSYYAKLDRYYKQQFADVFADKLPSKLPPKNGPEHCIRLNEENISINGRMMRVPTKYYPAMRRFIDENVKVGRLRPSSNNISAGTMMTPKSDPTVDPRGVHDYQVLNDNTIKDNTPLPHQDTGTHGARVLGHL
jgi:hypothetical protein